MLPEDPSQFSWLKLGGYIVLAATGGILGHILRTLDQGHKISWVRTALEGLGAGFVGALVLFSCQAIGLPELWSGVIVGVAG